jgi:hypothetical protein
VPGPRSVVPVLVSSGAVPVGRLVVECSMGLIVRTTSVWW